MFLRALTGAITSLIGVCSPHATLSPQRSEPAHPALPSNFYGDSDRDGVGDDKDQCPDQPEDADGFEDLDGCPDSDNDKDGVPDKCDGRIENNVVVDCRDAPEVFNGVEDDDGCPEQEFWDCGITLAVIEFSGDHLPNGLATDSRLDHAIAFHAEHPAASIGIDGHAGRMKSSAEEQTLSERAAEIVREALVSRGVAADRITAAGYGSTQPREPNRGNLGRGNFRVEVSSIRGCTRRTGVLCPKP